MGLTELQKAKNEISKLLDFKTKFDLDMPFESRETVSSQYPSVAHLFVCPGERQAKGSDVCH